MAFLQSWMLWGLLAVAVPIAIHLIHRRKANRVGRCERGIPIGRHDQMHRLFSRHALDQTAIRQQSRPHVTSPDRVS